MDRRTLIAALAAAPAALAQGEPKPGAPKALGSGPLRVPAPGSLPPLTTTTDYEALRLKRFAEADDETRAINTRADRRSRPKVSVNPSVLASGVKASNIVIPGPTGQMRMRVYMPEATRGPVGLYLHTHGGGWAAGAGLEGIDTVNSGYVRDWGCAVAQPDFRVSWDAKFPAAAEDCFAAYRYIIDNHRAMGVDSTRIGIGGGCTGANLATVVSLMARDANIQKPAMQWLWSGVFDTRNNTASYEEFADYSLPRDIAEAVTRLYLRSKEDTFDWRASPLLAPTLKGLSPALVYAGEWEVLRDETRQYVARLRDEGVPVTYFEGAKQPHAGIYALNPDTGRPTRYAQETLPKINAIMRKAIGPRGA